MINSRVFAMGQRKIVLFLPLAIASGSAGTVLVNSNNGFVTVSFYQGGLKPPRTAQLMAKPGGSCPLGPPAMSASSYGGRKGVCPFPLPPENLDHF